MNNPFVEEADKKPAPFEARDRVARPGALDILMEPRRETVPQEAVDLFRTVDVRLRDDRHKVVVRTVALQGAYAAHCGLEGVAAQAVHLRRAVERGADEPLVCGEEAGEVVRDKSGVGLQSLLNWVFAGYRQERRAMANKRFAALEGDGFTGEGERGVAVERTAQGCRVHRAGRMAAVKTVVAGEVAGAAHGLDQQREWLHTWQV